MLITIKGNLAKLNDHDGANRANKFGGAALKKRMHKIVIDSVQDQLDKKVEKPSIVTFNWLYSSNHDFDNIRFAAKYVLDGLQESGILPNDNQKWIKGFGGDYFTKVEKGEEGVIVEFDEWEDD